MSFRKKSCVAAVVFLAVANMFTPVVVVGGGGGGDFNAKMDIIRQRKLPPCRACKVYTDSFIKGMERTKRNKFEGGDAAWEEEKLRSYEHSEVRLVEIQERLCADVEEGREQCYHNNEQWDNYVEDWWTTTAETKQSLYDFLCIVTLKACCPIDHFGPQCTPCVGYPDHVCGAHGRCKGAGTRKGNGKCACDPGYEGDQCDRCIIGHYQAFRNERHLLCSPCHPACEKSCTAVGPLGCDKCGDGWLPSEVHGCVDIDECTGEKPRCKLNQFCVNNEGSYNCLACDQSCASCTGDGPDMCVRCAPDYMRSKDNMCIDANQESRKQYVHVTRYLTYAGLCVATCIIFQRSVTLAAMIGLAVAVYISVSEYVLNTPGVGSQPNTSDLAEQIMRVASVVGGEPPN